MLASFDFLEIEINSHTDSLSKEGTPQHSEASCTVGLSPVSPSLPPWILGKLCSMAKVMEGLEHGAYRPTFVIPLKEEIQLEGRKLLDISRAESL